jgi:hypothetical protein
VTRRQKRIGVILCLFGLACIAAAWPIYKWYTVKTVSTAVFQKTQAVVEKNPDLRPAWDEAMQDGVLTWAEAKAIVERAGETIGPEE